MATPPQASRRQRLLARVPAAGLTLVFLAVALLHAAAPPRFAASLLTAWGIIPFRVPFLDTETVLSALVCARQGVDVIAANPCDPLARPFDYSPFWLVFSVLPVTPAWRVPLGLAIDAGFLAALFLLPPARSRAGAALILLAAASTATAFALERGNNDLIIITLAALAATASTKGKFARLLGNACALVAGLLKYYPMLLLALAAVEAPRRFFAIAAACAAALGLFVALAHDDLVRALAIIPTGNPFGDMFGARTLPLGLAALLDAGPRWAQLLELALAALAAAIALVLAWHDATHRDLDRLTRREQSFLLAGAMLVLACFATAQNIGYRATVVLLAIPSLASLAHTARRAHYRLALAAALLVMWAEGWRHWLDTALRGRPPWVASDATNVEGPRLAAWALRELAWWTLVTLLASLALALLRRSTMGSWLGLAPTRPPAPPTPAPPPPALPPAPPRSAASAS